MSTLFDISPITVYMALACLFSFAVEIMMAIAKKYMLTIQNYKLKTKIHASVWGAYTMCAIIGV